MGRLAVLFLALILAAGPAGAVEIWATDTWGEYTSQTIGDQILKFDSADPCNPVVVGATGVANTLMSGLDFAGGTLYAYGQSGTPGLYTINRTSGAAAFVGGGGLMPDEGVTDLSFNPATGKMYAVAESGLLDATLRLYTINLATGLATLEKTLTDPTGGGLLIAGLATDADGTQYLHDLNNNGVFRIDGNSLTFLGAEGFNADWSQGLTIDWAGDRTLYHGAWNATQTVVCSRLYTVDKTTGVGSYVGPIGPVYQNLSKYLIGDIAIIPEAPTLGLLALGALGLARRR